MAACHDTFVIRFRHQGAERSDDGCIAGTDTNDIGPLLDLPINAPDRIGRRDRHLRSLPVALPTSTLIKAVWEVWIMAGFLWLNDTQWAAIDPLLPGLGGKTQVDDWRVINGIPHRLREGLHWRALPAAYGPRTTAFNRFNLWSQRGLWQDLFAALVAREDPPPTTMVDSNGRSCPARGRRRKSGPQSQTIGQSWGRPDKRNPRPLRRPGPTLRATPDCRPGS